MEEAPRYTLLTMLTLFILLYYAIQLKLHYRSTFDKVNRCLARYSPRATTTNQMSQQGLAQNEQKFHFRAKFGVFWAKNPNFYRKKQKFVLVPT